MSFHSKGLILEKNLKTMKKHLLSFIIIASSALAFSQVPQRPLVEHFTQASCGPCASQNPVLKQTLDAFGDANYVRVSHQVSWPGTDPMNAAFPGGPEDRRNYYGVTGVPNACLNGGAAGAPNTVVTANTLGAAAANTTPYDITVTQTWADANTVTVNIDVTNTTNSDVSDANRIFVSMIEKHVDYGTAPGSNGEVEFECVMRQMYDATNGSPDATTGAALGTIAAGATQSYSFTITSLPSYLFDKAQVIFAVYLQNQASKVVYQSAKSEITAIPGIVLVSAQSASQAGTGLCDYSYTPGLIFTNNDPLTDIYEVVAEYSIDGGAAVQQTFTGNLTQGQSATITFPATTLNPGTSVVSYNIVSANGGQPWSSPQAVSIPDEVFNKLNATATNSPLEEGMENATLEPTTGYSRDLTTGIFDASNVVLSRFCILDGPTYNYGAIGGYGNSNRSIRARFYSISAGETMNLIMQKVNLDANPYVSFDIAYKQYSTENDKLSVYISTDCGATWAQVFTGQGSGIATLPASTTQYSAPSAGDWDTKIVDLANYANVNDAVIRFEFTSDYGNNMFVDNININNAVASVVEEDNVTFSIFPNPTSDKLTVQFNQTTDASIRLVDVNGKVVNSQNYTAQKTVNINTSRLEAGVYSLLVTTVDGVKVKKVIVE